MMGKIERYFTLFLFIVMFCLFVYINFFSDWTAGSKLQSNAGFLGAVIGGLIYYYRKRNKMSKNKS